MIEGALKRRREGKNGMVVLPKEGEQNFPCDKSEEIFIIYLFIYLFLKFWEMFTTYGKN